MNKHSSLMISMQKPKGYSALIVCSSIFVLSGCTVMGMKEVPIVEWSVPARTAPTQTIEGRTQTSAVESVRSAPVLQETHAPTAGTYTVQAGDTLYSIALAFGQDARDIMRWNELTDPTQLEVGRTLKVTPGHVSANQVDAGSAATPVALASAIETRPLDEAAPGSIPDGTVAPQLTVPQQSVVAPASADWIWPVPGAVIVPFNASSSKGIDIAGQEGDPVLASNDGQVVYSGNSLRGYGNLVILKHGDEYVSAYAHNQEILVKKGQTVKRGELIAKLGRTDADSPRLHFEIRRQGKPVDPTNYLPSRP